MITTPSMAMVWPSAVNSARLGKLASSLGRLFRSPSPWSDGTRFRVDGARCSAGRGATLLTAAVLPMEPQPSSLRRQWFEGWFLRIVDHATRSSVALIFGSLRRAGRGSRSPLSPFDEHLVVLAYSDERDATERSRHVLLDGEAARVLGRAQPSGSQPTGARVSWWSDHHGGMEVSGNDVFVDVRLGGEGIAGNDLRLVANISGPRILWDEHRPDHGGPEGWLSRTGLLPCHYFVHSFGSRASYTLWDRTAAAGSAAGIAPRAPSGWASTKPRLMGERALAHVERNWGDAFPTGWVWAQATASTGDAFLVLTGGRFVIGPLTTHSHVIGLRTRAELGGSRGSARYGRRRGWPALSWDFRTTDLDRVAEVRRPCDGLLAINATSRNGRRRLELVFSAPPRSFGARIPVPTTAEGFSDQPGCRESYTAVVELTAWQRPTRDRAASAVVENDEKLVHRTHIPRAVLEFGGDFQC